MRKILVTAIGSFSADVVIRNLRNAGYQIVGCDIHEKEWVANSLDVDIFYQSPYATKREEYIEFIKDVCIKEKIEYVVPLTDVEVDALNANRNLFEGITICISSTETVRVCRDKYSIYKCLEKAGIDCLIPTNLLSEVETERISVPCVIKPRDGRSSQGLVYINERTCFSRWLKCDDTEQYIIQPRIDGSVVTVDIIRKNDFLVATPRLELLRTLNGAGTTVKVFADNELVKKAKKIADALNIYGCVNFEFIVTGDGQYKFLECNPRFSGGVAFSCLAGYDYITNHIKCFTNEKLDDITRGCEMIIARKYVENIMQIL